MVYGDDGSVYDIEPNTYLEGSSMERGALPLVSDRFKDAEGG